MFDLPLCDSVTKNVFRMSNTKFLLKVFVLIFIVVNTKTTQQQNDATLGIHDRIALLKHKIEQNINRNRQFEKVNPINDDFDRFEYEENEGPITPIMMDDRKYHQKFKLRQLKTTTTTEKIRPAKQTVTVKPKKVSHKKKKRKTTTDKKEFSAKPPTVTVKSKKVSTKQSRFEKKNKSSSKSDLFRRYIYDDENLDSEWTHCQDLITPFLTGIKTNISAPKILEFDHHLVLRATQLLGVNIEQHSKDEIFSIMQQLSNIQLRLFQWDVAPLKYLLNTINKEYAKIHKRHTFRSVQAGLRRIFDSWHLDLSNTTNLLKQARIFRPPCVRVTAYEGSTKTSRSFRYTKKSKPECSNEEYDGDC